MPSTTLLHPDVVGSRRLFEQAGLAIGTVLPEADNAEYGAAVATIGSAAVRYRVGKLTPKKPGAFVAVWRRAPTGSTEPFPDDDGIDVLAIVVRDGSEFGQFLFPTGVLREQGIVSVSGRGGKRGFRVYPTWVDAPNAQARRTQRWQSEHFHRLDAPDFDELRRAVGEVSSPVSAP